MNLEFCTTNELIDELMKRKTFGGLLVYTTEEIRSEKMILKEFSLRSSFDLETTTKLTKGILEKLRRENLE